LLLVLLLAALAGYCAARAATYQQSYSALAQNKFQRRRFDTTGN
jgi:hypothetical protein